MGHPSLLNMFAVSRDGRFVGVNGSCHRPFRQKAPEPERRVNPNRVLTTVSPRVWLVLGLLAAALLAHPCATAAASDPPGAGLCPADPAGNPAVRQLCGCSAFTIDADRLRCFDQLTRPATEGSDPYQNVSFTDLTVDGDLLRHRRVRISGFILLTPTSVYIGKSPLEIASAVKVDITDLPRSTKRVLYETCARGCQGIFTGTLEGDAAAPQIKADNALPP